MGMDGGPCGVMTSPQEQHPLVSRAHKTKTRSSPGSSPAGEPQTVTGKTVSGTGKVSPRASKKAEKGEDWRVLESSIPNGNVKEEKPSSSSLPLGLSWLLPSLPTLPWVDLNPVHLHVALLESYFKLCGLESRVVHIDPLTRIHCWMPSSSPALPPWHSWQGLTAWHSWQKGSLWCGGTEEEESEQQQQQQQSRQPILLIHGFGASAIWQWMHQVRALAAAGFDVYMPDLVFFGGSWSAGGERSEQFQAECLARLMTALGVPSFHVNGISYGGFVAYRLATMYPDTVRSLTMTNSGLLMTPEEKRAMLDRWQVRDAAELLLPRDASGVQRLMDLAYHRPPRPPHWLLQKTLAALFGSMVEEKRELLAYLDEAMQRGPEDFKRPEMDTILVWGRHDEVFPVAIAERMRGLFGNGTELVVLEHSSHMSLNEQPREYNEAIIRFLQKHQDRPWSQSRASQ